MRPRPAARPVPDAVENPFGAFIDFWCWSQVGPTGGSGGNAWFCRESDHNFVEFRRVARETGRVAGDAEGGDPDDDDEIWRRIGGQPAFLGVDTMTESAVMMRTILLMAVFGTRVAFGGAPPEKDDVNRYSALWLDSPFTSEPVVDPKPDGPGALDDYVLSGVSHLTEGYFVVLVNAKKRDERVVIRPGEVDPRGFTIERVVQDPDDLMATKVTISVPGEGPAVLGYPEKVLAPKPPQRAGKTTGARPIVVPHAVRRVPSVPKR